MLVPGIEEKVVTFIVGEVFTIFSQDSAVFLFPFVIAQDPSSQRLHRHHHTFVSAASQHPSSPSKRERIVYGMHHSHCVELPIPRTIRVHSWLQSQHGIASDAECIVGSCACRRRLLRWCRHVTVVVGACTLCCLLRGLMRTRLVGVGVLGRPRIQIRSTSAEDVTRKPRGTYILGHELNLAGGCRLASTIFHL
ncbi:hypothetical protein ARMGADRAFT_1020076 [Armillaria gallica]|uniref:Uncharacterized protein n=1 Tax=Armillaria gallica TaxID=47427 RepID=A0A2H3CTF0_ARMGA|nr:hypothetical protein ARMGADRAFT_1020076 [Armillaria gallica]